MPKQTKAVTELVWRLVSLVLAGLTIVSVAHCLYWSVTLQKDMQFIRKYCEDTVTTEDDPLAGPIRTTYAHLLPYNALNLQMGLVGRDYLHISEDMHYFLNLWMLDDPSQDDGRLKQSALELQQRKSEWASLRLSEIYPQYSEFLDNSIALYSNMQSAIELQESTGKSHKELELFNTQEYSEKTLSLGAEMVEQAQVYAVINQAARQFIRLGLAYLIVLTIYKAWVRHKESNIRLGSPE